MSNIDQAFTDADNPPAEEVVTELPSVSLSAVVIDQAYQQLKKALMARRDAEVESEKQYYNESNSADYPLERFVVSRMAIGTKWEVEIAKAEVDRVTTLLTFFQVESLFKAQEQFGPQ